MVLSDILRFLRGLAPEETALPDDPVGLLIGADPDTDIRRVGVCLDATPDVALAAAMSDIQLLVTHHPLIYRPLKRIDPPTDPISLSVRRLIKADIALYAMHTNWDRAQGGINDSLAATLEMTDVTPLGRDGAAALPRIGSLTTPRPLADFAHFVAQALDCRGPSALRCCACDGDALISRVAVCGGAGAFLLPEVLAAGAQAYVTSDVRHHEFLDASARGLPLLDAGHGATEIPGMHALARLLSEELPKDVKTVFL